MDVLDDTVDKYNNNNTYHRSIRMKTIDGKSDSFAEYNVNYHDKDPEF